MQQINKATAKRLFFIHHRPIIVMLDDIALEITLKNEVERSQRTVKFDKMCQHFLTEYGTNKTSIKFFIE